MSEKFSVPLRMKHDRRSWSYLGHIGSRELAALTRSVSIAGQSPTGPVTDSSSHGSIYASHIACIVA